MKLGNKAAGLTALAMACAPVVSSAATVLFTENFDTNSSARFNQFIFDEGNANDAAATYEFNYAGFTWWHESTEFAADNVAKSIPEAPRSAGTTGKGLRLDINNSADQPLPNRPVINLYPKLSEYLGGVLPSGDHKMTVDVWMNYNGRRTGGGGSTEHLTVGLNQAGGGIGGGIPSTNPGLSGLGFTVNGERGNGFDYRLWRNNTRIGGTDGLGAEVGYAAVDQGAGLAGPGDGENPYYQTAFPRDNPSPPNDIWYETSGSIGKHWTTLEMKYEDGIVYHYLKPDDSVNPPVLIAARTEEAINSGHVMLGYLDLNNGTAALETGDGFVTPHDANFVVYDNLVVETVDQVRQKWAVAGTANWSNTNAWQNADIADGVAEVADFTTFLPASQVVFVDSPRTVRSVTFDSGSPNGYTVSGANTLTLNSLTPGIRTKIKAVAGTHTIDAPLRSERPLTFDVAAGAKVKVSNLVMDVIIPAGHTENPLTVTKNGAGVAEVNAIVLSDEDAVASTVPTLTINDGSLRVTPNGTASGVSVVPALAISVTGKLDLSDNKLITKAALGTWNGSAYTGVRGLVDSGRGDNSNAQWNGPGIVTTDTRAVNNNDLVSIGTATASDLKGVAATATTTFAGQTVLGSDTVAMVTWGGDANLDGKINILDYGQIDFNVGSSGSVFGWYNGDFNYDGKINILDYGIIDFNVGAQNSVFFAGGGAEGVAADFGELSRAVPEPASIGVLALAATAAIARRRRQRIE